MLIDFAVTNFRSIKNKQVFSMQPLGKVKELEGNTYTSNSKRLLKSCVIYGGNASGKSNLLRGMKALEYLISNSSGFTREKEIAPYEPFLLDSSTKDKPVEFEINFIAKNGIRYNYAVAYNKREIIKEALHFYPSSQPAKLFVKTRGRKISVGESLGADVSGMDEKLFPNQLFLSKSATENIPSLIPVHTFFGRHFFVYNLNYESNERDLIKTFTKAIHNNKDESLKENVNQLLHFADVGITGVSVKEHSDSDFVFPKDVDENVKKKVIDDNKLQIRSHHDVYSKGKVTSDIGFRLEEESKGTQKLLALGGMFIDGLGDGDVIIVDEFDNSLHPMLTKALVSLFHSPRTNPNNAQLIFASHDVSLLSDELFRRDQICFAEKDTLGVSKYYSLADIKGVRKGLSYAKYYLRGAFGGTPILNEFLLNFNFASNEKKQGAAK